MNKKTFNNEDEKILISKVEDKYNFCKTRNKITNTDFLNIAEIGLIFNFLKENKINNYSIYGGREEADRKIIIFHPEKFTDEIVKKNCEQLLDIVRIKLPKGIKYEHREYLSGIMKLGIKREKFGDILVLDDGADIITLKNVSDYICNGLKELIRFRKSEITIENISDLKDIEPKFEESKIILSSIRIDSFVAEIARCSRTKAIEVVEQGKVFINSVNEFKVSKKVNINDIITIRGKGKFIFCGVERKTSSGKYLVNIKKYV